jgi:ribose-phosphate pyrophosphokinase
VLSGRAIEKVNGSPIEQLVLSNTIPLNDNSRGCRKIVTISVAEIFGEAIRRIHDGNSVSSLFA